MPEPSDTDLLEREFITRDPEALRSVQKTLPENYLTAEIEFWYDLTPPKGLQRDYVWCAHDGKKTHWRGYVMQTDDVRFLIGKDCGSEIFGHDFNLIARGFSALHTRQGYLIQLGSILAAIPAAIEGLHQLLSDPIHGQYKTTKARLRSKMPELYRNLVIAVTRRGASLDVFERVRDYAAELRRVEGYSDEDEELEQLRRKKERGQITLTTFKKLRDEFRALKKERENDPIYKSVSKTIGSVPGYDFFLTDAPPEDILRTRLDEICSVHDELSGPSEQLTTRKIQAEIRRLRTYAESVDAQLERLRAPIQFFSGAGLATVADWATKSPDCGGTYRSVGQTIVFESAHDDVVMALPAGYDVPRTHKLEILKLALSRSDSDGKFRK